VDDAGAEFRLFLFIASFGFSEDLCPLELCDDSVLACEPVELFLARTMGISPTASAEHFFQKAWLMTSLAHWRSAGLIINMPDRQLVHFSARISAAPSSPSLIRSAVQAPFTNSSSLRGYAGQP